MQMPELPELPLEPEPLEPEPLEPDPLPELTDTFTSPMGVLALTLALTPLLPTEALAFALVSSGVLTLALALRPLLFSVALTFAPVPTAGTLALTPTFRPLPFRLTLSLVLTRPVPSA